MSIKSINYRGYKIEYGYYLSEKGFVGKGNFFIHDNKCNYYTEHYFSTSQKAEKAILIFLKSKLNRIICKIRFTVHS